MSPETAEIARLLAVGLVALLLASVGMEKVAMAELAGWIALLVWRSKR